MLVWGLRTFAWVACHTATASSYRCPNPPRAILSLQRLAAEHNTRTDSLAVKVQVSASLWSRGFGGPLGGPWGQEAA